MLKRKDFDGFELGYKLMEKSHRLACGMKPYFPLVFKYAVVYYANNLKHYVPLEDLEVMP